MRTSPNSSQTADLLGQLTELLDSHFGPREVIRAYGIAKQTEKPADFAALAEKLRAAATIAEQLATGETTTEYGFGRFTADDAEALDGRIVTITTHQDRETGEPGETYGPFRARYLSARPDRIFLLPPDAPAGSIDATWIVSLVDIAKVETQAG